VRRRLGAGGEGDESGPPQECRASVLSIRPLYARLAVLTDKKMRQTFSHWGGRQAAEMTLAMLVEQPRIVQLHNERHPNNPFVRNRIVSAVGRTSTRSMTSRSRSCKQHRPQHREALC
jgi:hypothetical protein